MFRSFVIAIMVAATLPAGSRTPERPRIRDLGVTPGIFPPGPLNAITDVKGVRVGHTTRVDDPGVRTGVTTVLPHGGNLYQSKVPAAVFVGNGFGKAAGFLQVRELGNLESPVVLTNTLSVGIALDAVVGWTLSRPGNEEVRSVNAVVGETNDGYLNDIRGRHVTREDVIRAIEGATTGAVPEGSVGAGTGTRALGWKGGIGTSSRRLPRSLGAWTVGALVQSNFGGILAIDGRPVGKVLGRHDYAEDVAPEARDGSCMIVVATDAPVSPRNLERMARRAMLGMARAGSYMSNGSGDFVVAFSTVNRVPHASSGWTRQVETVENSAMSPLFLATVESVEEAIYNSLTKATTVTGYRGRTVEAIPLEALEALLATAP